jgi:hypothetical protein
MLFMNVCGVLGFGKKAAAAPPPPPPPPTPLEMLMQVYAEYPVLSTMVAGCVVLYLLLSIAAAKASKKPGKWQKPPASEVAIYKTGEPAFVRNRHSI